MNIFFLKGRVFFFGGGVFVVVVIWLYLVLCSSGNTTFVIICILMLFVPVQKVQRREFICVTACGCSALCYSTIH